MLARELIDWLQEGGAQIYDVEAGYVEEGWRGVVATKDIEPGSILVRVPERLLLSVHSARRDTGFSSVVFDEGRYLTSNQVLAAFLLYEASKGDSSFWHPYLLSLPKQYTCLSYFTPAEAEQLQAGHAKDLASSVWEALRSSHKQVKETLTALGLQPRFSSLAAWRWAQATVASRSMYLPDDKAGALTPFGDLHNHRSPPGPALYSISAGYQSEADGVETPHLQSHGSGYFDAATQEYRLVAQTRYKAGNQIFLCYGAHTNLELLEHYGFVLDDNAHDKAKIPLKLLPMSLQGAASAEACWLHPSGLPSWDLMKDLRLWAASQLGYRGLAGRIDRRLAIEGRAINAASEKVAFKVIQNACAALLEELPTTFDEDMELLSDEKLNERMRSAVAWRLAYKRTLQNAKSVAEDILKSAELQS